MGGREIAEDIGVLEVGEGERRGEEQTLRVLCVRRRVADIQRVDGERPVRWMENGVVVDEVEERYWY